MYNTNSKKDVGDMDELIDKIRDDVSEAVLYEQLAEECTELAKAALKKARKIRGENYTPKTIDEIDKSIAEEFSDVYVCSRVLDIALDIPMCVYKLNRWVARNRDNNDDV